MTAQIVIIGFMGTGKSTVARALAVRLDRGMLDLDELITHNVGRSPARILEAEGEDYFRGIETQALREVLNEGAAHIVSLGGGAWTIAENRRLISHHGAFTVWLDAPFELCWRRIQSGRDARPLAKSRELAEKLYHSRCEAYALAHARIAVADNDDALEITERIIHELSCQNTDHDKPVKEPRAKRQQP